MADHRTHRTDLHRSDPFPSKPPTVAEILESTRPCEPMSLAAAEHRHAQVLANIVEISRQIEDKSRKRKKSWASDPHEAWRKVAMVARDELYKEEHALRAFIDRKHAPEVKMERERRIADDIKRREIDLSTRALRKIAKKEQQGPIYDLLCETQTALLEIIAAGGNVAPLGESIILKAERIVPPEYHEQWIYTRYGTTWGHQAAELRAAKRDE